MSESVRDLYPRDDAPRFCLSGRVLNRAEWFGDDSVPFYLNGKRMEPGVTYFCSTGDADTSYEFAAASSQVVTLPEDWRFKDREVLTRALSLVRRMARGYDFTPDEVDALEAECKTLGIE